MPFLSEFSHFKVSQTFLQFTEFSSNMAKEKMLTASERDNIVNLLMMKSSTLEISKIIKRDHRRVKRFTNEGKVDRKQHKRGRPRMTTSRYLRKIKRDLSQNLHCTSKDIFSCSRSNETNGCTPALCPPLSDINCQKKLSWATKYLKIDFRTAI